MLEVRKNDLDIMLIKFLSVSNAPDFVQLVSEHLHRSFKLARLLLLSHFIDA